MCIKSKTDNELPSRERPYTERLIPLIAERPRPSRTKDRIESVEPNCVKSNTDKLFPNVANSYKVIVFPNLVNDAILSVLPKQT
jgi:hypothetical protein